jgi:LysR family glycine cleavage system transcriptional activator
MPSALPPLDSLRVLAACVRHSNFSKAAQELGLTPAAVSLRMRALEAQLGVKLFQRHGPRLTVSDQGIALGKKIEHAISLMQSAVDVCRKAKRPLRVTCAPTFASRWLVPRLSDYHALPGAQPITLDATEVLLPASQFDIAIRSGVGPWPGFSSAHLLPDEGTPMLSPALLKGSKRPSLRGLLKLPLITDGRWPKWFELAGLRNTRPRFAATRFPNYELEALAAAQGVGVALLSPFLFEDLRARGVLIAPFDIVVEGPNSYWALWPAKTPAPHFVSWLQGQLHERRALKV